MSATTKPPGVWPHPDLRKNQAKVPETELAKYYGQRVAWAWDGTSIIAGANTLEELMAKVEAMGMRWDSVVYGYIDEPGASYF